MTREELNVTDIARLEELQNFLRGASSRPTAENVAPTSGDEE